MVVNAEKLGGYSTLDNDSRITPVGRFIRRSSIDELPQLINVLKGEMSIVGPRPDVLKQKSEYSDEEWLKRLSVKPGITGLAQATLRSSATPEQRKRLDLDYVEQQSMWLDIKVIILTLKQVVFRGGN
jgi:lipopolysaccharide/colanic/teichoic acid biosynthesis glycosyltransferase